MREIDRTGAIELIYARIEDPVRETFDSGLRLGQLALRARGIDAEAAEAEVETLEAVRKIKPELI